MFRKIKKWITNVFRKDFWVEPFPDHYAPECFDCNLSSCKGCKFK